MTLFAPDNFNWTASIALPCPVVPDISPSFFQDCHPMLDTWLLYSTERLSSSPPRLTFNASIRFPSPGRPLVAPFCTSFFHPTLCICDVYFTETFFTFVSTCFSDVSTSEPAESVTSFSPRFDVFSSSFSPSSLFTWFSSFTEVSFSFAALLILSVWLILSSFSANAIAALLKHNITQQKMQHHFLNIFFIFFLLE